MAETEARRVQLYRNRAEDIRIMAQGFGNPVTRDKLMKVAAATDALARRIERKPHAPKATQKRPFGLVVRARLAVEPKKQHPLTLYARKWRKGFFGAPRDLHSHDPFGRRDQQASTSNGRTGWIAAFLASLLAWARLVQETNSVRG